MRFLTAAALCAALAACHRAPDVENHDPAAPEISGLSRQGDGPYAAGALETFKLVYSTPASEEPSVSWTASAGTLVASGDQVSWTLPAADEATLTASLLTRTRTSTSSFHFRLTGGGALTGASAAGVIDTAPTGSSCDLAFNPSGNPVVIYRNDQHAGIWYAVWSGSAWQTELVDGMGYEVGGTVDRSMKLVLASDGTPHLAYALENGQARYATKSGGSWTRERVDSGSARVNVSYGAFLGIALDPAHSNRPTISYTDGYPQVVIAARTGANTWSNTPLVFPNTIYANDSYNQGGLAIDSTGLVFLTFLSDYPYLGSWNGTTPITFSLPLAAVMHNGNGPIPLLLDGNQRPIAMLANELVHVTPGSNGLTNAASTSSPFEESAVYVGDLAYGGGKPHLAYNHASGLEFVQPDPNGYWVYAQGGAIDLSSMMGAAVDGSGVTHACYQLNGKINYQ